MPGVTVGDNVIIALGSIVTKNIPSNEIWGGIPAKRIESIDEYYKKNINNLMYTNSQDGTPLTGEEKKQFICSKLG